MADVSLGRFTVWGAWRTCPGLGRFTVAMLTPSLGEITVVPLLRLYLLCAYGDGSRIWFALRGFSPSVAASTNFKTVAGYADRFQVVTS